MTRISRTFSELTITATLGLAIGLTMGGAGFAQPPAAKQRPNMIVILADDLGYGDVCAYGCQGGKTPHIDALAAGGIRFTQGYVTAPICSPSRAGLMTGRYQQRFGHELNAGGTTRAVKEGLGTPVEERMLPRYLKDEGYATGMVGKWHLGPTPEKHPLSRGFDEFFGFLSGGNLYLDPLDRPGSHFIERGPEGSAARTRSPIDPIMRGREAVEEPEYLTDAFTREAVSFIERHRAEPFFLYVAYNAPHTPLQVTDEYYQRFPHIEDEGRRIYAAMVAALDDGVGAIVEALRRTGIEERTLVVFASDNGCATYTEACFNDPLLAGKLLIFEGGFRVPFLASWKGTVAPGQVSAAPVSTLDLLPTALELAGATAAPAKPLDGESLVPLLRGERDTLRRDTLVWRVGEHYAVRKGTFKLVQFLDHPPMLFDLAADPGERYNVATSHRDRVEALAAIYRDWAAQTVPPLWETRLYLWLPLQDILDNKPLNLDPEQKPGPGVIQLPI